MNLRTTFSVAVILSLTLLVLAGGVVLAYNWLSPERVEAQAAAQAAEGASLPRTITVVGEGKTNVTPDMAQTTIGVEITGPTVKDASGEAADTMEAVMTALKGQGIAEKDMQTSGYSIWVERPYGPEGPRDELIYHVSNSVTVTIRDLDRVGAVLDAAIEAGANNIWGVNFNVADPSKVQAEARSKAVADAKSKAGELARLAGVRVGEVVRVSEVVASGGGYYPGFYRGMPAAEGLGGAAGPISPGELEISVQLEITYAIQ